MGSEQEKPGWKYFLVGFVFLVTALLILLIATLFNTSFGLPTLALGGILVLLAALLCFSTLMNVVGLSDKTQALGLPEGSVRAIVALALVGLFAILASSFLLTARDDGKLTGFTQEQVVQFTANNKDARGIVQIPETVEAGKPQTYTIAYSTTRPTDDFSKQMMTLVGTLMTAVVSFYFGAMPKSASEISRAAPELSGIENGTRPAGPGPHTLSLTGTNLNSIKTVRVSSGSNEFEGSNILSSPNQLTTILPSNAAFATPLAWDVAVVDDLGRTAAKKAWLTFTGTTAPAEPKATGVAPLNAPETATEFTISGSGLDVATGVEALPAAGGAAVAATNLKKTAAELKATLTLTKGTWTLRVARGPAAPIAVPGTITVT